MSSESDQPPAPRTDYSTVRAQVRANSIALVRTSNREIKISIEQIRRHIKLLEESEATKHLVSAEASLQKAESILDRLAKNPLSVGISREIVKIYQLIWEAREKISLEEKSRALTESLTPLSKILLITPDTLPSQQITLEPLTKLIFPFLQALSDLQTVINDILGRTNPTPILIKKIESNSPVTVSITGITEAFQVLINYIVPWRRAHAHQSAELTLKQQEAQIADLEAQTKSKQTEVRKQRAEAKKAEASATAAKLQAEADAAKAQAEAIRIHAEAERLKAEATKLHAEAALLQFQEDKGRYELAVQIILQFGSHLPDQQKLTYITQLAGPLHILTTSPLEPIPIESTD